MFIYSHNRENKIWVNVVPSTCYSQSEGDSGSEKIVDVPKVLAGFQEGIIKINF